MADFSKEGVIATGNLTDARRPGLWAAQSGDGASLVIEGQGGESLSTYTLSNGTLSHQATTPLAIDLVGWIAAGRSWAVRAETLDRLTPAEGQKLYLNNQGQPGFSATFLPLDLGGGRVYIAALPETSGLYTLRPEDEGLTAAHVFADTSTTYAEQPSALTAFQQGGTTYVAAASGGAVSGLTLYSVSDTGALTAHSSLGQEEGIGVHNPTALSVVDVNGECLVVMGAAGSSSLSVFAVSDGGALSLRSHTIDTLNTRFDGLTVLDTAQIDGETYLVAGGADDGLSLFLILPGGQLAHLDTIADGVDTSLANISAIELLAEGSTLHVFAASQAETGLTHLTVEFPTSWQVLTGTGGAETLTGGAGDDVLFDGAGADHLTGAAGADVFVFAADDETDRITDFAPGEDKADLSGWGRLYTLDQLTITSRDDGAQITFGDEVLILQTADGESLTLADFVATDMLGLPAGPRSLVAAEFSDDPPGDDTAPGDGDASPVDTTPLVVSAPDGWEDDGSGGVVNSGQGVVFLGHAEGNAALLRVENGTVAVSAQGEVTVDGDVYAEGDSADSALFTGSFTIAPGALTATGFTTGVSSYGLLDDLVGVNFSGLGFAENSLSLGADLDFPAPLDALDTTGAPLVLRFGADGPGFGPGPVGTSGWLPDVGLPLSSSLPVDLSFSDLGVDYDALDGSLYLSGHAALGWGGTLADQFGALGVPAQALTLDLAGGRTGAALFERGDAFLRLRPDNGELAWDVVGEISYSSDAGFLREFNLGLDTIGESFNGSATAALSSAGDRIVTGEVTGLWDPVAIDSLSFGMDGLNLPVATSGLFLQGGALSVDGLAPAEVAAGQTNDVSLLQQGPIVSTEGETLVTGGPGGLTYSGTVAYTYGSAATGQPTPFRGDITGSLSQDGVSGAFSIRSTPGYILGDAASGGIVDVVETYFGLDASDILEFDLLEASGDIEASFVNGSLNASLEASVLGGLFSGSAEISMYEQAGVRNIEVGAEGRLQFPDAIPVIGGYGVDGSITVAYSGDGDLSNDFIAAWTTIDLGLAEYDAGLMISFDGGFTRLNSDQVELIGSWELGPEMEVAVMSAAWETARPDAELVVITPDGTRLTEADIAARDDIAIAPGLTTDTSRHVAVERPEAGIWDIEVVAPGGLGEITYSVSDFRSGPSLGLSVASDDREAELAELSLTVDALGAGSEIVVNALENRDAGAGIRLDIDPPRAEDGTQTLTWSYADFAPGVYHLEAVAQGGGLAPEAVVAETVITVDAHITGTVSGAGSAPLSDTTLRFSVEGDETAATLTDADGGFTLRAPPDTAGQLSFEREVTGADRNEIGVSDALDALRLAVGLEPSWGPADAADYVAADFNADSSVGVTDALEILRTAVGLNTEESQPRWVFGDIASDIVDADTVPVLTNQLDIAALTADTQINIQAILVGNMENYV